MRLNMLKRQASGAVMAFACGLARAALVPVVVGAIMVPGISAAQEAVFAFNIPAGTADHSLKTFSEQSAIRVMADFEAAAHTKTQAVKGRFTGEAALRLMLTGSDLEIAAVNGDRISLRSKPKPAPGTALSETTPPEEVTEVIVTGTHIRGGNPTSPVHTVTRKDIEQSGYSQIGDVMRSLPENFSGGQNPGVIGASATNINNQNVSNGSSLNLRGLGSDATLVLLNGHRMGADSFYQAADISGIPLGAVQRVEIVADGASALYGSDAVAGVVNIITRRNFDGGALTARLGETSEGGAGERTYSFLKGISNGESFLLANLEYSKQFGLVAGQRRFTSGAPSDETLVLPQERRSLFISSGTKINDRLGFSFDGLVADRKASGVYHYSAASALSLSTIYTPSYNAAVSMDVSLPGAWKIRATGVASGSRNSQEFSYPAYAISGQTSYKNYVRYGEATADGSIIQLPSGEVRGAFGTGYREEGFDQNHPGSSSYTSARRSVAYLFGEILVPLVSPSSARTGLHRLELNISARAEEYSDLGRASTPKIGLKYAPLNDLSLRATWGESFKAPSFTQMYQPNQLYLYDQTGLGGTGLGTAIMTWGGNPSLAPEKSSSWTIGGDYSPSSIQGLDISATYFNIDYVNRIVQPVGNYSAGLSDPIYAPFVKRNPSASDQADLIAISDGFFNYSSGVYDASTVVAILENQYTNATSQTADGVDLGYKQRITFDIGSLDIFANATWLRLKQQTIVTAPNVLLSGTIFNPPEFKARGGLSWKNGGLTATAIVNFVGPEDDTGITPNERISSWTTVDGNFSYSFTNVAGYAKGLTVSFAVANLLDKSPPYAVSPAISSEGLYFDSTNASIIGRTVSLSLTKAW